MLAAVSFLTPLDGIFAVGALVPLAALLLLERRSARVRRLFGVGRAGRRALVPVALALALLPGLVAVAAAQPVVVHERQVTQRGDVQAFFVLDTSLSMAARARPGAPSRLERAKRLALRLERALPDIPIGLASMTDRALPYVMPTTDPALFRRTLTQAVGIDEPPPSQLYHGRATTFEALTPFEGSHFFSEGVHRRLLVVFTDGEASSPSPDLRYTLDGHLLPLFVHVWAQDDRIFRGGRAVAGYHADPSSTQSLAAIAQVTGGRSFSESQIGAVARAARAYAGTGATFTTLTGYTRTALAPWFVLAGVVPLGFLLYRRNL